MFNAAAPAQTYGLDALQPIGKFLDNKLPATTPGSSGTAQPPALLSQVGAFTNLSTLTPRSGLIPFTVNAPLWTDGAAKKRWMAIPNDGIADTAAEQITFSSTNSWLFPKGAVLVKEFDLPINDSNQTIVRRMETRFLVHGEDGVYYGITYRWRADGTEADLLPDGDSTPVTITTATGGTRTQTWTFPSRADCRTCHNAGAGRVLGARTQQLNGLFTYPATGRADNQLRTLNHLNLFSPALTESDIATYPKSASLLDTAQTLEHRVRSYLDSNCSHCHYPGNPANLSAGFDARLATPLSQQNIINGGVLYDLGLPDAKIIAPRSTLNSVMHQRLSVNGLHQMPPIGRNTVDTLAVSTLTSWINGLAIEPPPAANRSPLAGNDEAGTPLNTPVTISVLVNDSDPDGDALTATSFTAPTSGVVSALAGNQYRFTPANGFTGTATFSYTVVDGRGGSSGATVTIRVLPPATSNSTAFFDGTARLSAPTSYSGVAMGVADMDNDGLDDIVHLLAAKQVRIEYQKPAGAAFAFKDVGTAAGANQWALCMGDADNNGYPDIMVGGYYDGMKYYRSNANGTAYSLTNLTTPSIFAQATGFVDINRDGWLDVFACHDDGESAKFRNTGNGTLVADASLINARTLTASDNSGNYGIVWTDYDNDGDVDLYLSKCRLGASSMTDPRRINQLFRNNGNGTFTDVAPAAGLAFGEQSWASDFGDIDNDGDMDCYVGNHGAISYMMRNNGNGTFTNITAAAGMNAVNWRVIQTVFRDFNNDGWTDLLLTGEQQQLWINNRNSTFSLLANPFQSTAMESCAVGDLNRDGFTDIYAGYASIYNTPASSRPDKLFLAQSNGNGFLSIRLRGVASNAGAIGARIELSGPWGTQVREVRGGEGYGISHSQGQIFGMGSTGAATRLRVIWPSGASDDIHNVAANQFLTLREGGASPPTLANPGSQNRFRSAAVSLPLSASDPTGDVLTFSATGLPAGLGIDPATGLISGTISATALSSYSSTINATDGWTTVSVVVPWTISGQTSPTVVLTTGSSAVTNAFDVAVSFSEAVSGLSASDFQVTNGTASTLSGSGSAYIVRIIPSAAGTVNIALPANSATSAGGMGNAVSNALPVHFTPPDTTPPGVTLFTASPTISGAFTVTATFTESVSGLNAGELTVSNGSALAPVGSGSSYSFSVTPAGYGAVTVSLPAGVVADPAGNLNTASNSITVTWPQPNRAPVLTSPGPQTTTRGTAVNLAVSGSDPDGQAISWSATGLPAGLSISASTGVISGMVDNAALASNNTTITVSDGILTNSAAFTWSTTAAAAGAGLKGEYFNGMVPGAGTPLLVRTDANIDFDWGGGSPAPVVPVDYFSVRWSGFLTAPFTETYTFWVPSDNGVRVWINGQLQLDKWTPDDIAGWHSFTLPLTANQSVPFRVEYAEFYGGANITVFWYSNTQPWEAIASSRFSLGSTAGQNLPPVLAAPTSQSSVRNRAVSWQLTATDPELDTLVWSASGLPAGLSINAATGKITGTILLTAAASHTTSISVFDGTSTTTATFPWTTTAPPPNQAAVLQNPGTQTSIRGSIVSFSGLANDPDGDALTWSATGLPAGLSLNSATGLISGTILNGAATSYGVTLTVTDPGGLSSSVTFTWNTVAPPLHGLRAEYFDGLVPGAAAPVLVRTDSTIDFDWGGGSPAPIVPVDYFSARWTGSLTAPYSETFTFWVPSDNGVRVWINNQLVLDKWTPDTISGWHTFNATLTAGAAVPFKVEYAELYGGANIAVYWYSNSQAWEAVGTEKLTPAVVLPPNSAHTATTMISATQQLSMSPGSGAEFSFARPSSSASLVALIVESSTDLVDWKVSDLPAEVNPTAEGTDEIRIRIPEPGSWGAPERCYYRVHMLVPPTPVE